MEFDPTEFGKAMGKLVHDATAPLLKRLEEQEAMIKELSDRPVPVSDVVAEIIGSKDLTPIVDLCAADAVEKYLKDHPAEKGEDGKQGEPGSDGVGLAGAMIDRHGELVITLTNGDQKALGPVVGKDGADFTDFDMDYDGERTITIKGRGGEIVKHLPIPMDKGYWREGMDCQKGDILTNGGNAWIALCDTKSKPCLENRDDWRLFARKGRDGKDGRNGIDKTKPVDIKKKKDDGND